MGSRVELHNELLKFSKNVYFQPPSSLQMVYPCIIYSKSPKSKQFGNDATYISKQGYQLMVIDRSPTSTTADELESYFQYCTITQYYTVDSLNHTTLNLYY